MTYVMELHGGINDGLRLPNTALHPVFIAPASRVIKDIPDYVAWDPAVGETVDVYALKGPPRPSTGITPVLVHHLYLDHQMMLRPEDMRR